MDFNISRTKENIMRAFAGESQARNRYIFAAEKALNDKEQMLHKVFLFTADQELAHAKIFYNYMKECAGTNIKVNGNYPIDTSEDMLKILRAAEHNENEEFSHEYAEFAKTAEEEGFMQIANSFKMIGKIEKSHSDRFKMLADLMEDGKLYISDIEIEWMCLNCGYIFNGKNVPQKCPVCSHEKGYFIRLELVPFSACK